MKKIFFSILLSVISFGLSAQSFEVEVIQDIDMSKDEIYTQSLSWMAEKFVSAKDVIQLKDKEAGKIIGKGYTDIKIGWLVLIPSKFTLKIDAKDNKYRLTFKDVIMDFGQSGGEKPIESTNLNSTEQKARDSFNAIAASLQQYLVEAETDEW